MTEYQQIINPYSQVCPYCHNSSQVKVEDCSEAPRIDECDQCGKKYRAYEMFSVNHYSGPDCELNNQEHQWEPIQLNNISSHDFCSICGKERPGKTTKGYLTNA